MKRRLKVIVLGVCIGLFAVVLKEALHIDEDVLLLWYWVTAAAVVLGAVLINVLYNVYYQRKMKQLVPLLEAGKAQEYIAGVETLLRTAKGQGLRKILTINLAAGYIDRKEYDKAVALLEGISDKGLTGSAVKTVYRLNLCTCYFHTAQYDKALALYNNSQAIFEAQRGKMYGGSIALLDMLAAVQSEQYEQAEQLLDKARKTWSDPKLQEAFREIENTLKEIKKENVP